MATNVKAYDAEDSAVLSVKHASVDNKDGYYGFYLYDKNGVITQFVYCGPEVILTYSLIDIDTWIVRLGLSFNTAAGLNVCVEINRGELDEAGMMGLANYGCQVNKKTALCLAKVIENQEPCAPVKYIYEKIGWGFINNKIIFKGSKCIGFDAEYKGQLSIKPTGKFTVWKDMVDRLVLGNERLETALAFGFSAVLLDFLKMRRDVENIIISICGESTTGKSTAAYLAISTGCYPGIDKDSLALTFLSTENALVSSLSNNSGFPVMIDEASLCKNKNLTTFLYTLSQGKEKARLNKDCSRKEPGVFSTTVITTAEHSLLNSADQNTGLLTRVGEYENVIWTENAETAEEIKDVIHSNYGHAIPMIAEHLIYKIEDGTSDDIYESYDYWRKRFVDKAKEDDKMNGFVERFAKKTAVIMTAVEVAKEALHIDFNLEAIFTFIDKHNHVKDIELMDIGNRAYQYLVQSVFANSNKFRRPSKKGSQLPVYVPSEIWGVIQDTDTVAIKSGGFSSKEIKISQKIFDKIIYEGGFNDPNVVLNKLRERGILSSEKDRYISKFDITGNGECVSGYIIRMIDADKKSSDKPKKVKAIKKRIPKEEILSNK